MSISSWEKWEESEGRLRHADIRALLEGTELSEQGVLSLPKGWGGTERYAVALAMYARLPAYQEAQRVLDLRWIPLSRLPVAGFSVLEEIYLHENDLAQIPSSIAELRRLRVLSLGRNRIASLPRSMATMWLSLRRLILGDNRLTSLPFTEDEMLIEQGSIGTNPLAEPVGSRWMERAAAADAVQKIRVLLTPIPGCSRDIAAIQIERGIALCRELAEPMIYEQLFEGYTRQGEALVHGQRKNPWERAAIAELCKALPRDTMLDRYFFQ